MAVEVATVNLEFNLEWLASVNDLRAGDVATIQDVIQAELDVALERKRLADAQARTAVCRATLSSGEGEVSRRRGSDPVRSRTTLPSRGRSRQLGPQPTLVQEEERADALEQRGLVHRVRRS